MVLGIYTYVKSLVLPEQYSIVIWITNPLTSVTFYGNVRSRVSEVAITLT